MYKKFVQDVILEYIFFIIYTTQYIEKESFIYWLYNRDGMETKNIAYINYINKTDVSCPRCRGQLFFDLVVHVENSVVNYGLMSRCCGSDFVELQQDFGLEV